ncbi:MAG: flagellin [Termitinemataceae bacterium]|nr:MAG: flagellin [Termitinemataceae bacterium]
MVINHNLSAMFAERQLGVSQADGTKQMEKLSSGQRINRAGDDASGLAVSEKMRSQIRGLNQANRNIQNGVSFIQTTEGYLQETQDILGRMRELSVQAANGIYTDEDRMQIQVEVSQLVDEVDRIASHAQFNTMNMLTGAFASGEGAVKVMQLQIGANMDQNKKIYIGTMTMAALFKNAQAADDGTVIDIKSPEGANKAIGDIDQALTTVSKQRADLGAYQNRFELAAHGVAAASENLQASESRIRDQNMASGMVDYTRDQILNQAGIAMLAQANVRNQSVLQLLG